MKKIRESYNEKKMTDEEIKSSLYLTNKERKKLKLIIRKQNLKIINFENNEGETQFNPLQEKTYRGKEITIKASRINPGATTTITVRGEKSNLKKVIVVKVNEEKTFESLSPFNENAVVTDSIYY